MRMKFSECLIRTPISSGEILGGFYARHHVDGYTPTSHRPGESPCERRNTSTWLLPTNLNAVSESLWQSSKVSDELLANNTLFPSFSRLLPQHDREFVEMHHRFSGRPGVAAKLGMNNRSGSKWTFAACAKCVVEDVAADGNPFWRRDHFMPGIIFCGRHQEILNIACTNCMKSGQGPETILKPKSACICRTNLHTTIHQYRQIEIDSLIDRSRGFSQLLDINVFRDANQSTFSEVFTNKAIALGLIENGVVKWNAVRDIVSSESGSATTPFAIRTEMTEKMLKRAFLGNSLPRNPLSAISLFQTFFGTWSNAEIAIAEQIVISRKSNVVSNHVPSQTSVKRRIRVSRSITKDQLNAKREKSFARNVEEYRRLQKLYPTLTHKKLLFKLSGDSKGVTTKRLAAANIKLSPSTSGDEYLATLDMSLSNHIRQSHQMLLDANLDTRISRAKLLVGHRGIGGLSKKLDSMPETTSALADCEESNADFRRRCLKMLALNNKIASIEPTMVSMISKFGDDIVKKLLQEARRK